MDARPIVARTMVAHSVSLPPPLEDSLWEALTDPELALDFSRVVHGSQSYEYVRPLREGETLTVRSRIESVRERAGAGVVELLAVRAEQLTLAVAGREYRAKDRADGKARAKRERRGDA